MRRYAKMPEQPPVTKGVETRDSPAPPPPPPPEPKKG